MLTYGFAAIAAFALIVQDDPITRERGAVFGVSQGSDALYLVCKPDEHYLEIGFRAADLRPLSTLEHMASGVASRFGNQEKSESGYWDVEDDHLDYAVAKFGGGNAKARFIDMLANNTEFNIRYQLGSSSPRTVTIAYTLDPAELRRFIALCGDKGIMKRLTEMHSIAAPIT